VLGALDHVLGRRLDEFWAAYQALTKRAQGEPAIQRVGRIIDLVWKLQAGPSFDAFLELVVASRTNPTLRRALRQVIRRFDERVREAFATVFPGGHPDAITFVFALLDGLAIDRIVRGQADAGRILGKLKRVAGMTGFGN